MPATGYSGTPLAQKLGIKSGMKLLLLHAPANYHDLLGIDISRQLVKRPPADLVHLFAVTRKELEKDFYGLIDKLGPTAMLWISWYKKSAKMPTGITEDIIREIVLPTGWVDVKVCAVSELWSGLKIVKRVEKRL
jgi:hypothetical protein